MEENPERWRLALRQTQLCREEEEQVTELMDMLGEQTDIISPSKDKPIWSPNPNQGFSVKRSYIWWWRHHAPATLACGSPARIWKTKAPRKLKIFLWLLAHRRLLTRGYRAKWRNGDKMACALCGEAPETVTHLFCTRTYAENIRDHAVVIIREWARTVVGVQGISLGGTTVNVTT
ncbi:hypothetical protein QJS10_CPA09g01157 [Acorus calamus]|uniref:Reverse transcriptase zinc-binding domain-containing protein n=1 Tax=Acorus calamus TaxID=4465 RepID=A0AAV9E333_ACOCL|nr:hypothetical protein QJS10_CPA09g01157 [Acorus calamus]